MIIQLAKNAARKLRSWLHHTLPNDTDNELTEIPESIRNTLQLEIQKLKIPGIHRDTVRRRIREGIEAWQSDPYAPNALVFLGNPVDNIEETLIESIRTWKHAPARIDTPLAGLGRTDNPHQIRERIERAFATHLSPPGPTSVSEQATLEPGDAERTQSRVVLIPCLEQHFIRRIGGWEGIELIRDTALQKKHYFWVLGCNQWTWDFLSLVCEISAFFDMVTMLPDLDGEMIQNWLHPIVGTSMSWKFDEAIPSLEHDKIMRHEAEPHQTYWESVARQSCGIRTIAGRVWLESLRIKDQDDREIKPEPVEFDTEKNSEDCAFPIFETKPTLPSLPSLSGADRYLLHSLLLHSEMSIADLAGSLGQLQSRIQPRLQSLLRLGVIERHDTLLKVHPLYYSKLRSELKNNNFFVCKD